MLNRSYDASVSPRTRAFIFLWHLLWAGSRPARRELTVSGTLNCQHYRVVLMVYTPFTNVVAGRVLQPGRPWVGDQCPRVYATVGPGGW
jgi:hypothetical protein